VLERGSLDGFQYPRCCGNRSPLFPRSKTRSLLCPGGRTDCRTGTLSNIPLAFWLNMGTDSSTCNDINVALSLLVRVLVSFLPLTFTVLAIYGSDAFGDRFKRWTTPIIGIAILFVTARLVLTLVAFFINPRMCTIVGPNHHQIWADYLASYGIPAIDIGNALLYVAIPTLATFLFLRPIWVTIVLSAIGPGTLIPLRILLPLEWASVWCWVSSLFLFFALVEPIIGQAGAKHFSGPIALLFRKD